MIDSKPVQPPYLSLVPFKNFGDGDAAMNIAMSNQNTGSRGGAANSKNSQVKWNRLLHEDLEELYKEKALPETQKGNKRESILQAHSNNDKGLGENESSVGQMKRDEENALKKDKLSSEEKRRRQAYKEEQELRAFEERGGFAGVLRDIFRPQAEDGVDLDSVHQLSSLCTGFYQKKYSLDKRLVQALDALTNERPNTLSFKKKHSDVRCSNRF